MSRVGIPSSEHLLKYTGSYAELIQNRAFQGATTPAPWVGINGASLTLDTSNPLSSALPTSVLVTPQPGTDIAGLYNPGWYGIFVTPQMYSGSFFVSGTYTGDFIISLTSGQNSAVFASVTVSATSTSATWTQIQYTITPASAAPDVNNVLSITFNPQQATDGFLRFNLISLFPPTFTSRANGCRPDLVQTLSDLNPTFFRFPGGNNMQGGTTPFTEPYIAPGQSADRNTGTNGSHRWIWSDTIGPLTDRPGRLGDWGYWNTDGLGLAEYLNLAADLDMMPVLDIWSGKYLNKTYIAQADLQPYVDDALNELEYVLGSTDTTYGALRASHGYPDPWDVTWVEIGNEDSDVDNIAEA